MLKYARSALHGMVLGGLFLAGSQTALAQTQRETEGFDMFQPWRAHQEPFVSKALIRALRKNRFVPAIVVLRPVDELSSKNIDFKHLQRQIARIQKDRSARPR